VADIVIVVVVAAQRGAKVAMDEVAVAASMQGQTVVVVK